MTNQIVSEKLLKWFTNNRDKIVIPNIQRDFEWNEKKIEDLFDSINRGYFIGLIFTWDFAKNKKTCSQLEKLGYWTLPIDFKHKEDKIRDAESDIKFAILDGQQRLSALSIGLFGKYKGKSLYFNTKKGIFQFKSKNEGADKHLWKKVSEIRKDIEKKIQVKKPKETAFKKNLTQSIIARFPLTGDIIEITEIFKRINISGTRLSPNHVLLAKLMSSWKEEKARKNIETLKKTFKDKYKISIDYSFIIQTALFLTGKSLRKKGDFSEQDINDIKDNWADIEKSILKMGEAVKQAGFSSKNIFSLNALIPIVYIVYRNKKDEYNNESLIKRFLYTSFFKKKFARATDAALTNIRNVLDDNGYSLARLLKNPKFKIESKRDIRNILNSQYGQGKSAFMALSILYPHRLKSTCPLNIDHMHPKNFFESPKNFKIQANKEHISKKQLDKLLKDLEDLYKKCNSLANLELLEEKPNKQKKKTSLKKWIKEVLPKQNKRFDYKTNFISKDTPLELKYFKIFYDIRRKNMEKRLEGFFRGKSIEKI